MKKNEQGLGIAIAILAAGAIVAGAIMYSNNQNATPIVEGAPKPWTQEVTNTGKHLLGNAAAPVIITEYSDTECPYCSNFHETMKRVMNTYGTEGKVAWVYRHFPLDNIHKQARNEAESAECVAELAGNETFWKFLDAMFTTQPTVGRAQETALRLGVNQEKYESCVGNDVFADLVDAQSKEGIRRGIQGTPHSIISSSDGQEFAISGAYPFEAVSLIIEMMLADKDATVIQGFIDLIKNGVTPDQMIAFLEAEFPEGLTLFEVAEPAQ